MSMLGSRLEAALELLAKCESNALFADIGSDHAFFAIEAIKRGIAERAIASDINPLPLQKGRENAEKQALDIEFVLSDGFDSIENKGVTSAAVCGMGGELIAGMLLRSETAHRCELILQPMSAPEELRRSMWENGFLIIEEKFVTDSGKPYVIIRAKYSGNNTKYSYCDLYLGQSRPRCDAFSEYCKKSAIAAKKRRLGHIARNESTEEIDCLIAYCEDQTQRTSL